jgi:hypothetical protein
MEKWGLGIEHEMCIRFSKKTTDLEKNIKEELKIKNEYVFFDSNTLLYYFYIYEIPIMKKFKDYMIESEDTINYYNKILLKNELLYNAKNNIPFPLENKNYFNLSNNLTIKDTIEFIDFYLMIYCLYHSQLLFFNYNLNNEITITLKKLFKYNNIIEYINNKDYNKSIKLLNESFDNLYNNKLEDQCLKYLKKLYETKNIDNYILYYSNLNKSIIIDFNFSEDNKKNKISNNKNNKNDLKLFIIELIKYIDNIKFIFDNNINVKNIDLNKFYNNLYLLYSNNIPHIDGTYKSYAIEFKTINYENMNYEKALHDLMDLEKTFFYTINNLPIFTNIISVFGDFTYHNIGSIGQNISIIDIVYFNYRKINYDYTGSYHIWITAPYNINMDMKKFINIHVSLANKLQLLEPILAAHYSSPSYNALNKKESKSSLREFLNGYSNYGTSDITLMYGTKKHNIYEYYLSEKDIFDEKIMIPYSNKYYSDQSYGFSKDEIYKLPIYDNNNKLIINYNKLIQRSITNNIFKLINKGNEESNDVNIENYFSKIFQQTNIRPKTEYNENMKFLKLGADIRTRDLNSMFYPLNKDWNEYLIMKKNKLITVYYNKKLNKISYERIYDEEEKKRNLENRVGIEFRIFDHFPINFLNQILGLLVPIVLDSCKDANKPKIKFKDTYVAKQFWHDEMFNVINNGYKYTLSKKYINILEKEFNVKLDHPCKKSMNTENILSILYEKLSNKYQYSHKDSLYKKMCFTSKIYFLNFNKKAWFEIIKKYFENNPLHIKRIKYLNKNIKDSNIIEIIGKNYNIDKIKNYLENELYL